MSNDDSYPNVADLHNYVAIGSSKDLSISIEKETFDSAFIITTIILFIIFIIIIVILLILNNNITNSPVVYNPAPVREPTPLTVDDDYGSSKNGYSHNLYRKKTHDGKDLTKETCLSNNNRWDDKNNICICKSGYYGQNCNLEFYDANYIAVGNINPNDIKSEVIGTYKTKYKSFKNSKTNFENNSDGILDESCSNLCDENFLCNGFYYHHNTNKCILYPNITIANKNKLKYSFNTNSTLYTKSLDFLNFENIIFLGESEFSLPKRHWLFKNSNNFAGIKPNTVSYITFIPKYIKYNYNYIGFYSPYEFQQKDIENILIENSNSNSYIHLPYTEFNIPIDLLLEETVGLFVLYIPYKH
jgi:hypothetical protein